MPEHLCFVDFWLQSDCVFDVCMYVCGSQGFWDMVNCQVEDLFMKFSELEEMEMNDWIATSLSPKSMVSRVKLLSYGKFG